MPCKFLTSRSQSISALLFSIPRMFWLDIQCYSNTMAVHILLFSSWTVQHNLHSCKLFYCQPSPDPAVLTQNIHPCSAAASVTLDTQNLAGTMFSSTVQIPGDLTVNKAKFLFSLMPIYTTLDRHVSISSDKQSATAYCNQGIDPHCK